MSYSRKSPWGQSIASGTKGWESGGMNSMKLGFLGGLLLVASIPLISFAAEFRVGDQPSFPAGESIANDLYLAGGNVSSAGELTGDLAAAGGNVLVNSAVSADALLSGGTVTVLGAIEGDLRFGAGNVTVQGAVGGDVIGAGGQLSLTGPSIGGDVALAGGSITISAPIQGVVHITGGDVRIDAPIQGNVFVKAESLTLGPKAVLAGNLTYTANAPVALEDGALVRGTTEFNERPDRVSKAGIAAALLALLSLWMFAKFLMLLLGAAALAYFFNRYSRELVATAAMQPWVEMLRGLVIVIVLPVLSGMLLLSVIGIPLGLIGMLAFMLMLIFAHLASSVVIGSVAHKWIRHPAGYTVNWKTVLLGVTIVFFLSLIPFLGAIVKAAACLITLGAALNIKWAVASEWR